MFRLKTAYKVYFYLGLMLFSYGFAGEIHGKIVLDHSVDASQVDLSQQIVRLNIFKDNEETAGAETTCDKNGDFNFTNLETSQSYSYSYYTLFQSVPYISQTVKFNQDQERLDVGVQNIYASTNKASAIESNESFFISVGKNDVMKVVHQIRLNNTDKQTYHFSPGEQGDVIEFKLMEGAYDLRFLNGIYTSTFDIHEQEETLTFKEDLYPGQDSQRTLKYSYLVPLDHSKKNYSTRLPILRKGINVFVDDQNVDFISTQLNQKNAVQMFGKKQQVFSGGPFAENTDIQFEFKNLPTTRGFAVKILLGGSIVAIILFSFLLFFDKKITLSKEEKVMKVYQRLLQLNKAFKEKQCTQSAYQKQRDVLIQYLVYLEQ